MFFRKKTSKYEMNNKQAEDTLSNIFKACNIKELVQEVSLKEIQERHRKENNSYHLILSIAFVFLLLLLISPFAFHKPAADFQTQSNNSGLQIFQHHVENSTFHLTLSGSDIDYNHIEIYTSDGESIPPTSYDEETNTITFTYTNEELNLFIPDTAGNTLHLLLTPNESN
ncbi:MAG: hypothetical protein E7299_09690 [Lachnospiraceae bacterium]|nr:hypothetical protein [Lachnospiraceae bacterium]